MKWLKKHTKIHASSLFESVIALAIISCCIYASIIYSNLFFSTKNQMVKSWEEKEMNTYFYELNINSKIEIPEKYEIFISDTTNCKQINVILNRDKKQNLNKRFIINEN